MKRATPLLLSAALALCFAAGPAGGSVRRAPAAAAQCRTADRAIPKRIRFEAGRTSAVVKDTVRVCTSHDYRFRAKAGQRMTVHLVAGRDTMMTVFPPTADPLLDGGKDWEGELPETGTYTISVATDRTAKYTLEITIR